MAEKRKEDAGFEELAEQGSQGVFQESIDWIRTNRKWWLAPIVVALLIAGLFVVLSGTAVAPFIYALF